MVSPTLELRAQVDRTIDRGTEPEPCSIGKVLKHSMWSKSSPVDLITANNLYMNRRLKKHKITNNIYVHKMIK